MANISTFMQAYKLPLLIMAGSSIFLFIATPLLIPLFIRNIREDYFIRVSSKGLVRSPLRKSLYFIWHIIKNILGISFLAAGIIMLFIPGQGILTILIGIILLDLPGKHRFINRLARGEKIRRALNWIRRKTGQPEFIFSGYIPEDTDLNSSGDSPAGGGD